MRGARATVCVRLPSSLHCMLVIMVARRVGQSRASLRHNGGDEGRPTGLLREGRMTTAIEFLARRIAQMERAGDHWSYVHAMHALIAMPGAPLDELRAWSPPLGRAAAEVIESARLARV